MARKMIMIEEQYRTGHAEGRLQLKDLGLTIDQLKGRYPFLWRFCNEIMGNAAISTLTGGKYTDAEVWMQAMTTWTAGAIDGVWEGNGAGWAQGTKTNSRNQIHLPNGWGDINYHIPVSQGGVMGWGNNIATASGGNTSYLEVDHPRWIGASNDRTCMRSTNWGTSNYFESGYVDNFRINGKAGQWKDPSYTGCGLQLRQLGEGCNIATQKGIYIHDCNDHGFELFGTGPGNVGTISSFDNNGAGFMHRNGNSLGLFRMNMLSMDNNAWGYYNDAAGAFDISTIKCENGLSLSRGKEAKSMPAIYANGWITGSVGTITYSLGATTVIPSALILEHTTGSLSRVTIQNIEFVVPGGSLVDKLLLDGRANRAYKPNNFAPYKSYRVAWQCDNSGVSVVTVNQDTTPEVVTNTNWAGNQRLGVVASIAQSNYDNATPVFDPTNGNAASSCSWVTGTWSAWSPCKDGFRTRTRTVTSSVAGCTPAGAQPASSETEACAPTADTVIATYTNFTNTDKNMSTVVSLSGVRRIKMKGFEILEAMDTRTGYGRMFSLDANDTNGLRVTVENGPMKMPDGTIVTGTPGIFKSGVRYADVELILTNPLTITRFGARNNTSGSALKFKAERIDIISNA